MLSLPHEYPRKNHSKRGLRECLRFLQQIGDMYWHACYYHDFFDLVASRLPEDPALVNRSSVARPDVLRRRARTNDTSTWSRSIEIREPGNSLDNPDPSIPVAPATPPAISDFFLGNTHPLHGITSANPSSATQTSELPHEQISSTVPHSGDTGNLSVFEEDFFEKWFDCDAYFQTLFPSL